MTKLQKLKNIYKLIREGHIVAVSGRQGNGYVWIGESNFSNRKYIHWQNFGSSANRMGLNNLRWIINVIFESRSVNYAIVDSVYGNNEMLED